MIDIVGVVTGVAGRGTVEDFGRGSFEEIVRPREKNEVSGEPCGFEGEPAVSSLVDMIE